MPMVKRGSIRTFADGHVETFRGTPVPKTVVFRGHRYTLAGATNTKSSAERSARGWREHSGGAIVRKLEPGNYGIYAANNLQRRGR